MLLAPQSVVRYLVARGQLHASDAATVEELGGGVSCVVLRVESASGRRLVAKQARPRLQVADEWMAPVGRVVNEAAALRIMARILPGTVPLVLDVDREANVITIECAPRDWRSWKQDLMDGVVESATARFLGKALGRLHSCSLDDEAVRRAFADRDVFTQLRIDPYYRTTAARRPEVAAAIETRIDRLNQDRRCLVHGDFAPKNVLVGPTGRWIIDLEVAHIGSPLFDTAFMVNHLLLKAIHNPGLVAQYHCCVEQFLMAYREAVDARLLEPVDQISAEVGCLMLARVDGKSPAEYLTPVERDVARELGRRLLLDPCGSVGQLCERARMAGAP